MRIILPKTYFRFSPEEPWDKTLVFFLAGPVRGGGDWQQEACRLIAHKAPNSIVAVPTRWEANHPLTPYKVHGSDNVFPRQLNWERHYLEEAGLSTFAGCIIFWLPLESRTSPHPGPEPYSMDTRGELAEWRMRMKFEGARVVVGAEEGFHGLSQIQRNFSLTLGYEFPIHGTLEATIDAALKIAEAQ